MSWLSRRYPHKSTLGERWMLAGTLVMLLGCIALSAWNLLAGIAGMIVVLGLQLAIVRGQRTRIQGESAD